MALTIKQNAFAMTYIETGKVSEAYRRQWGAPRRRERWEAFAFSAGECGGSGAAAMISSGQQIAAARVLLGWTQQELADASKLHRRSIQYWEREERIPFGGIANPQG
jgi:hypothetical protein